MPFYTLSSPAFKGVTCGMSLPEVLLVRFHVGQTYSLSSLAFKRVTSRSAIHSPTFSPNAAPKQLKSIISPRALNFNGWLQSLGLLVSKLKPVLCTKRQLKFEIIRSNRNKIGMNTISNRFFNISKLISLESLNLSFVHFKKLMKIQFLKNGKT